MKKLIIGLILVNLSFVCRGQADTNFVTRILRATWTAEGKDLFITFGKFDRSRKTPPAYKEFRFNIASKELKPLSMPGAHNSVPSPDGKIVAFMKPKENNKADLYLYVLATNQEIPLVVDTFYKFSPSWSPDGRNIVYDRESNGHGRDATIEICVVDVKTKEVKQITESGKYKSYEPIWAPQGDKIVYYLEKGDNHDQIWLTDAKGSFHTNLTNDTTTHNFYPSWIDAATITYTQARNGIMLINIDGSGRQQIREIGTLNSPVGLRYNPVTRQAIYNVQGKYGKLMLYDWTTKTSTVLLDEEKLPVEL